MKAKLVEVNWRCKVQTSHSPCICRMSFLSSAFYIFYCILVLSCLAVLWVQCEVACNICNCAAMPLLRKIHTVPSNAIEGALPCCFGCSGCAASRASRRSRTAPISLGRRGSSFTDGTSGSAPPPSLATTCHNWYFFGLMWSVFLR